MKVGIIGAGPAGLTAAYQLAKAGIEVDLFEASDSVGGLSKSIELWNQRVDLGPHRFFSRDKRVNTLWLEIAGSNYDMVQRLTRIYYKNTFFNYPLHLGNTLKNLGFVEASQCLISYLNEVINPTQQDGSFENWVVNQFGRHLFEIFFKSYSEKLWGINCKQLDADFASQRIKKLSLIEAIKNAVLQGKGNKHNTLVDRFAYPHEGTGFIYETMAQRFIELGGRLFLNHPVHNVTPMDHKCIAIHLADSKSHVYDHVISSMPLTLLVKRLPDVSSEILDHANALRFRNTILVYLHINSENLFPDNWVYVHDSNLKLGRITNFRNWSPHLYGSAKTTILALEYWSYPQENLWNQTDENLIRLGSNEISKTGLVPPGLIIDGKIVRINRCYPVYDRGYKTNLKPIEDYLNTIPNLIAIGRYGAFKYNNQDHSILMGILAADKILTNSTQSLWEVNTNYESYQEAALITDTGLLKA